MQICTYCLALDQNKNEWLNYLFTQIVLHKELHSWITEHLTNDFIIIKI